MAVLIYSVHCIHGGTALIFRTLCPWLYEVLAQITSSVVPRRGREVIKTHIKGIVPRRRREVIKAHVKGTLMQI